MDGFEIATFAETTGGSVSGAGDIDGDGFADVIVGGTSEESSTARVYFGSALGFNPTSGFEMRLDDPYDYETAISVSAAGDVNGNGFADVIVGVGNGDLDQLDAGQAYVVYGKVEGFAAIDLEPLTDDQGFVMKAEHDVINLTDYDADPSTPTLDAFHFIGAAAFSGAAGELRYEISGKNTDVGGDTAGDAVADFTIRLTGNIMLPEGDFLLNVPPLQSAGGHLFLAREEIHLPPQLHLA